MQNKLVKMNVEDKLNKELQQIVLVLVKNNMVIHKLILDKEIINHQIGLTLKLYHTENKYIILNKNVMSLN